MELTQRIKQRLRELEDWTAVIDELEAEAASAADKPAQSRALSELALACEELFLDKARAMTCYQQAFKLDQSNLEALGHARRIYQQMAHLEMVTRLMTLELQRNTDESLKASLSYAYGTAQLNQGNVDAARPFLETAQDLDPDHEEYAARFQEVLYDRKNWRLGLETVLTQLRALTASEDPLGVDVVNRGRQLSWLYLRAARILQQESPDDPRLLPCLFKALDANPSNDEALYVAETILAAGGHLQHIQKLQDRAVANTSEPAERLRLLLNAAAVWQVRLNNPQMADYFYHQALDLAFEHGLVAQTLGGKWVPAAYRRLTQTADASGNADALISLADRGLAVLDEADAGLVALLAGDLAWRKFNDVITARKFFSRAAALAPAHPFVVEFRRVEGDLEPVPAAVEEAPRTDDERPTGHLPIEVEDEATQRVGSSQPDTGADIEATGAHAEATGVEATGVEATGVEATDLEATAAEPSEPGVQSHDSLGAQSPSDAERGGAGQEPADAVSERDSTGLADAGEPPSRDARPTEAASSEDVSPEPAAAVEPVTQAIETQTESASTQGADERGGEPFTADEMALIRAAEESESTGGKRTVDLWRDAVAAMPARDYPRAQLKRLYAEQNKWSNVADVLKDHLKHVPDEDIATRERLHWELVEVYRDHLRQSGLVVTTLSALEKMLDEVGDVPALLRVLEVQQQQFEQLKRWSDVVTRIRRRAEISPDARDQKALHLEAGQLFLERFNNQAEAIKSFEAVLDLDPADLTAITKLTELYERRRDWERMIGVQQKQLALIADPEERRLALLEVARMAGQKIKKPALSIELWSQVLELEPGNVEALQNLEVMQEREKAWPELAHTLEQLCSVTTDPAALSGYLIKLGQHYTDKLNDNAAAITTWERLYELEPDNRRAQDALKKLYLQEGRMDALEQFYARQDKWGEFVRVLEREADGAEGEQKTAVLLKIADLYRDKLGKPDRATRALEKALNEDGDNLVVAERLLELYEEAGDERGISRPLRIKLDHCQDGELRQPLLERLAELAERVENDRAAAFNYYRQAFRENHLAEGSRAHMLRLAGDVNGWPEAAQALGEGVDKFGDDVASLPVLLELAEVQEQKLVDLDAALKLNQAVLEIDPEHPVALASLERLFLALGRDQDLLEVLNTTLSLTGDPEEQRQIQRRIGGIHEQLGRYDDAIKAYQGVLETGVEDPSVLAALDRIYLSLDRHEDLADVLARELVTRDLNDVDGRCELLLRLGALHQEQLGNPREAVGLFSQILSLRPDHDAARTRLEHWLDDSDLAVTVAGILLPVYESQENWPSVVRCLEIQAEAAGDATTRVELLLRIGAIAVLRLGDGAAGFSVYARAFGEDPLSEVAQVELENLAAIEGRWGELTALYEDAVTKDLPSAKLRGLLTKLAELYDGQLNDSAKAIAAYQRAVELDPADMGALDALVTLYSRDQNWSALLEVYRNKVEIEADPSAREALRFGIAALQEDMLSSPEDAIVTYTEILADDDTNVRAIAALDRLYSAQQRWPELAEILARQLSLADDASTQIQLSLRLGAVRLEQLGQTALAIETYARVLELDPHAEAAVEALEGLLADEQHQLSVARLLESVYRGRNDWPRLVQVYEIMVKHSLDPNEKILLLHQIGELYEIGGDEPRKAFSAYARALREDAANRDTQDKLEGLARQMGAYVELVGLYESVVEGLVDDELRISLLSKVAQTYEAAIDDAGKAAGAYEQILAIDPTHFAAIDALIEVHRRRDDFSALVQAVVRKAEMVDDPDDQKTLLLYAASIRDGVMADPAGASELYQRVLTIDDADRTALNALVKLYIQLERWEPLKDVYQRLSELATDPEERRQALYVLGQVYDAELHQVDRAIDTYQAVLDIDPSDEQAIAALDRLYGHAERWLDQLQILERAVSVAGSTQEQTAYQFRIGGLWELRLGDMIRAVESYREVLVHDSAHGPTIEALERIVHGDNEPMVAAQVLAPLYDQHGQWERLVGVQEVMIRWTEDPVQRIERLHQMAGVYERHIGDFARAFDAYARALAVDPQSEHTIAQLERLSDVTGEWDRYAEMLATQAANFLDPDVQVPLLTRLALICELKLQDTEGAIKRWLEVLAADPENPEAISSLDRIFSALERWPALVENLQRQIAITADEATMIDLHFRSGQIYQHSLGDSGQAIAAYREILNLDPTHVPTLDALEGILSTGDHQAQIAEILEPIYHADERWDALIRLGDIRLSTSDDIVERLQIIQQVADICEHRIGEPDKAYVWWLRAYIDDPLSEQACAEMERLAEVTQEWGYIVEAGNQILEDNPAPEVRLAVLTRSAAVLDHHLRDFPAAVEAYRQVLELEPDHAVALAALDRIYTAMQLGPELAEILQRRIRNTMDGEALVDLEVRLAQVFERDLASLEQAIGAYHRALGHDPRNHTALARLESIYLSQYRWRELFDIYQKMVDVANTDEDMADGYQRMAKLASDALDREDEAVELWNRVLELRGDDPVALGELARLHEHGGRWDELVEVLHRQVLVLNDAAAQVQAYQTLATVYGQRLERDRDALDAWLSALAVAPDNLDTLQALHRIYGANQSWSDLVETIERLIALGPDVLGPDELRDLYAQLGRVQADELMASDAAIEAWHHVLNLVPADPEALRALEDLYRQQGRWEEAIDILERKSKAASSPEERVDVLMQIGATWEERLSNHLEAAGAYQEVLEHDAAHLGASEALEQIYRETGDWGALAELLINRAEVVDQREMRVATLQAAAEVFEQNLDDVDMAFATLQAAFNIDYANDHTSRELERIATQAGKWGDLLNEYNGLVQQIEDLGERCELWVKIGRWYGEHLQRPDYGIQSLEKALELNPESVSALRELASFHRRGEHWDDLAQTLMRIVPVERDPDQQSEALLELAALQETQLGDLDAAVESHRRVLEIDGDRVAALDALMRLHERREDWQELVAVLERRAAVSDDPDARLRLRKHAGYIQEVKLLDAEAAIDTHRAILADEPTDLDTLQSLERLYFNGTQVDEYLEILEAQLDVTNDAAGQISLYEKMAHALVTMANEPERAAEVLEKIVLIDPARDSTYRQLEELYTGLERWLELVETYRSHVNATDDPQAKVALLTAMGQVYRSHLEDVDRAIETYANVLEIDPYNYAAADILSGLQEAIEDWPNAIQTLIRLADLTTDPSQRTELLTRIARVQHQRLYAPDDAEFRLNQALEVDPNYVPALVMLGELYKERGDWLKASRVLEAASDASQNLLEKTNLAAEVAFIYEEELDDRERALAWFARTIALDPEHIRAGKVLIDIYFEREQFADADPIFDMLTRKVDALELSEEEQRELFVRAAKTARALQNSDKALKQYKRAYDLDSTNHEVLSGMADLLFEGEDWERAFKLYQTILVQHRDTQSDEDTVQVYFRLGNIKTRQGEPRKALNYLEKALEVDPHHQPTLHAVIALQSASNNWEEVIQAKRALIETTPDGDAQFELWKDIGELYLEQLANKDKAAQAFASALELKPDDRPLLQRMLDLYQSARRWTDVIEIIDRVVELEADPKRRSLYHYTVGVLLRDELGHMDEAVERFNAVLDDDPSMLKAFQAVDTLLTKAKDWKQLERAYRKMLKRLPSEGDDALRVTLWSNLGEIYRTRLQDFRAAAAAFDVAAKLEPENLERHIKLAELHERLMESNPQEHGAAAVREHQVLIANEPFRYESYHALFNIYVNGQQVDKAFCVASVLSFLKKATDEEQKFVDRHKRGEFVMARQRLSEETLRRHVFHPDEDLYLTGILALIAPAMAAMRAVPMPNTFNASERVDIQVDPSQFSRMAKYVKDVLNVSTPDVYLRPNDPGDLVLMNVTRDESLHPTMVVFQNLLRVKSEAHLAFALGRYMSDLYLPHYCYVVLERSPQNLKQAVLACLRAVGMPVPGDAAGLDVLARNITSRMAPAALDQLRSLMQKFIEAGGSTDVKRWAAASELTAYRVGLLLCHDLKIAGQMISHEQSLLGSAMGPRDKVKELVLYSISEDYFAARQAIGVTVS